MNPYLALIIANVIWGIGAPIYKLALQNIPPFTLAFVRFAGATVLVLPFYLQRFQPLSRKQIIECFFVGFFGITMNISFFFLGLQRAPSINAPIVVSSGPIFLYFLSVIFLKEKFKVKVFTGMMIGFIGVLSIILAPLWKNGTVLKFDVIEGNIFFLLAMLGSIISPLIQKGTLKALRPFTVAFWMCLFGALSFFPFMAGELQRWSFMQLRPFDIFAIGFGIIFSSAIAYSFLSYGVNRIDTEDVGLFTYLDPVAAVVVAFFLLSEVPDKAFLIGTLFVFGGIFIAEGRLHWHPFHKLKTQKSNVKT